MTAIAGSVVWVTGASSGIGEALAFELGRRGAKLALSARSVERLNSIRDQIIEAGGKADVIAADVCELAQLKTAAQTITSTLGPIDILIANAGTHVFTKPEMFDSEEYLKLMDINFGGMVRTFESVIPDMLPRSRGHLVGVASVAGYRGLPRAAAYGASKSAMIHFMESLRFHLKKRGLKVSICNPGFVKTPLTDKNDFHMPFLISAQVAAKNICDGIEEDRYVISFPWPFNWIMRFMQLIPFSLYEQIVEAIERRMKPQ